MKFKYHVLAATALAVLATPASAVLIYYQEGFTNNLHVFDSDTNTNSFVGDLGLGADSTGMAFAPDGTLYLYDRASDSLYTVNIATGATTLVGASGIDAEDFTISLDGTTGYITSNGNIYSINLGTGAATLLGAVGLTLDGLTTAPTSVTFGATNYAAGTIFGVDSGSLYALDLGGLSFDSLGSTIGANETLDFAPDGTLWGQNNNNFYTIDSNLVATVDGPSTGTFAFGMAILPGVNTAVPEPSTWAMMLLGFGAVGFSMRRSRRSALRKQIA